MVKKIENFVDNYLSKNPTMHIISGISPSGKRDDVIIFFPKEFDLDYLHLFLAHYLDSVLEDIE